MGNSLLRTIPAPSPSVHPHVHGELGMSTAFPFRIIGSSPRAWGTLNDDTRLIAVDRFIPTCMGNSGSLAFFLVAATVHPHVHGELCAAVAKSSTIVGSSPRAWGTHAVRNIDKGYQRFIPTCMGNSFPRYSRGAPIPVHPHVHGELSPDQSENSSSFGSSPRAWGTLIPGRNFDLFYRFIPTCMGNSSLQHESGLHGPVHPHVHGELRSAIDAVDFRFGSSPRAWGTRSFHGRI